MTQAKGFRRIEVDAAREIHRRGGVLILDVRDADSYRRGHIEGAELATKHNFSSYLSDTLRNTPVIIYCYHGD